MKKQKVVIYILILITILQIGIRIYIGNRKTYFHMDESYSYGLMNYNKLNIADNTDFSNVWHNKEYYLDYLTINEDEKFNLKPVYENQKNDVHPPLYYLFLRIATSFTINKFTKWTGITLNIIIFAISNILIFKISKELFKKNIYGLLACIVNGFSLIALNANCYIRMYELANLATLLLLWCHLRIYNKENVSTKDVILIAFSFIFAALIHYYTLVFGVGLYLVYTIKSIKNKQKSNLLKYQIAVIASGLVYLAIFPYAINHVFFSYRGVSNENNNIIEQAKGYLYLLNKEFFNGLAVELIIILLILCNPYSNKEKCKNIYLFLIPAILYFIIVTFKAPYIEIRYFLSIYGICNILILYIMRTIIKGNRKEKNVLTILTIIYTIILVSPIFTETKLDFTYEEYNELVKKIKEENKPIVYVFDYTDNRFLDDIYLFTLVDKSIIVDENTINENILKETEITLICKGNAIERLSNNYNFTYKLIQNMNAYNIYEIYFT